MATLVGLRHPVTIFVTDFTSPDELTNDILIHILEKTCRNVKVFSSACHCVEQQPDEEKK